MPLVLKSRRALTAVFLLVSLAAAQQCYYPNGSPSTDTPCSSDGQASCCGASSFCMDNGLCFNSGIVSRGSCTDKTWASSACTPYCKTTSPSSSIAIMPCLENGATASFACGLNASACNNPSDIFTMAGGSSFDLRASQVAALIEPVLNKTQTQNSSSSNNCPQATASQGMYTSAQMAGLGCGLGIPLIIALCISGYYLFRERPWRRPSITEPTSYMFGAPPPASTIQLPALQTTPASRDGGSGASRGFAFRNNNGVSASNSREPPSFLDQYQAMSHTNGSIQRVELDGSPVTTPKSATFAAKEGEFF